MITLFSDEEILDMHIKSERREAAEEEKKGTKEAIKKMISERKITLGEVRKYFSALSGEDIKELENELMHKI